MLLGLAANGEHSTLILLIVASVGNVAGAMVNYWLGRAALHLKDRKWFPVRPHQLQAAEGWFQRWGQWSLLFAWLPVVGDPLTVIAGVLRSPFPLFCLLVAIGKTLRYAALLGLFVQIWG